MSALRVLCKSYISFSSFLLVLPTVLCFPSGPFLPTASFVLSFCLLPSFLQPSILPSAPHLSTKGPSICLPFLPSTPFRPPFSSSILSSSSTPFLSYFPSRPLPYSCALRFFFFIPFPHTSLSLIPLLFILPLPVLPSPFPHSFLDCIFSSLPPSRPLDLSPPISFYLYTLFSIPPPPPIFLPVPPALLHLPALLPSPLFLQ